MAWGAKQTATQLTGIQSTEKFFTSSVNVGLGDYAHVQIKIDFPADPVDTAIVSVYATLDATSEVWDTEPIQTHAIGPGTDKIKSFVVNDVYKFRVGVVRSGSTDTLVADMAYRVGDVVL